MSNNNVGLVFNEMDWDILLMGPTATNTNQGMTTSNFNLNSLNTNLYPVIPQQTTKEVKILQLPENKDNPLSPPSFIPGGNSQIK